MARCLSGEASDEEFEMLQEALQQNEALQQQYEILKQFWSLQHVTPATNKEEDAHEIKYIIEKGDNVDIAFKQTIKKSSVTKIFKLLISSAAAAIIICISIYLLKENNLQKQTTQKVLSNLHQLVTAKGSRNRTILPDGSIVWLNANSSLSYPNFSGEVREVFLKGEAFFDVVKQKGHPFIVHANGIDIKVLGTAFDVKSYSDDNKVEATLIRGLIQVTRQGKENQRPVYLHPNEKLVIDFSKKDLPQKNKIIDVITAVPAFKIYHLDSTIKKEDISETAWVYNRLEFNGDSFEELAKKLERWYNIKIIFTDEPSKHLSFHGSFENETVEQAFEALKVAVPFEYSIQDSEVTIRSVAVSK